jgi:hypothetical protein
LIVCRLLLKVIQRADAMKRQDYLHYADFIADILRKSAYEIELFEVQADLGMMEALAKFEELKKVFYEKTLNIKLNLEKRKESMEHLLSILQDLRVQFALGKAETKEAFEEQKKKIMHVLHELKVEIKNNPLFIKTYPLFINTLEQVSLKLEIISEKLSASNNLIPSSWSSRKELIDQIVSRFKKSIYNQSKLENRLFLFQEEIELAYKHLVRAFVRPYQLQD